MNKSFQLEKTKLIELYINQELSTQEVANKLGCSDSHVLKWLHEYRISVRPKQATIPGMTEKNLRHLYIDFGWSTIKIAKHLNCNDESVRKALKRHNIPIRTRSEAGKNKIFTPEHLEKISRNLKKMNKGLFGENHPAWKGGRYIDSYGYVIRRIDGKTVKEHRYVMQQHLGRKLEPWEEVNHINLNKQDNRVENLEVIYSEHKHKDWLARQKIRNQLTKIL